MTARSVHTGTGRCSSGSPRCRGGGVGDLWTAPLAGEPARPTARRPRAAPERRRRRCGRAPRRRRRCSEVVDRAQPAAPGAVEAGERLGRAERVVARLVRVDERRRTPRARVSPTPTGASGATQASAGAWRHAWSRRRRRGCARVAGQATTRMNRERRRPRARCPASARPPSRCGQAADEREADARCRPGARRGSARTARRARRRPRRRRRSDPDRRRAPRRTAPTAPAERRGRADAPAGVTRSAFSARLSMICRTRIGSVRTTTGSSGSSAREQRRPRARARRPHLRRLRAERGEVDVDRGEAEVRRAEPGEVEQVA